MSDTDANKRHRSVAAAQWKGKSHQNKRNITVQAAELFCYSCALSTGLFTVQSSDYDDKTSTRPPTKKQKTKSKQKQRKKAKSQFRVRRQDGKK